MKPVLVPILLIPLDLKLLIISFYESSGSNKIMPIYEFLTDQQSLQYMDFLLWIIIHKAVQSLKNQHFNQPKLLLTISTETVRQPIRKQV